MIYITDSCYQVNELKQFVENWLLTDLYVPRTILKFGFAEHNTRSSSVKSFNLWNELPTDLKEQTSLNTFKNELKLYLITKLYNDN